MARASCIACIVLLLGAFVTTVSALSERNRVRPLGRQLARLATGGPSRPVDHGFRRPNLDRNWDSLDTNSFSDYDQDHVEQGTFQQKLDHFNANESADDAWTQVGSEMYTCVVCKLQQDHVMCITLSLVLLC
jgi:hypothetical protein